MKSLDYNVVRELVRLHMPDSVLRHYGWSTELVERMEKALNNLDRVAGPSLAILTQKDVLRQYRSQQGN